MDEEISSEELASLLGNAAPPPTPLPTAGGEGETAGQGKQRDQVASSDASALPSPSADGEGPGVGPHLDDEISADELVALGFEPAPAKAPPAPPPPPAELPKPASAASAPAAPEKAAGATPRLPELTAQDDIAPDAGIGLLMDVPLRVSIELGRISMTLQQVLGLGRGSIIELERLAGEPVDILVNDKLIGRGEVVVIDEYFGVKITELIDPKG